MNSQYKKTVARRRGTEETNMSNKLRIIHYLREYRALYGYSPTYREIADGLEISLGTVCAHIASMKRMGLIKGTKRMRSLEETRIA